MPPTQQKKKKDKQKAAAAAVPTSASKRRSSSSKKSNRKKSKARIPPYKTYNVVAPSAGGGFQVLRPVNQYDVLCVDGADAASSKQNGYDYSKQPGNAKYAMLVDLSQNNFNKMVKVKRRPKKKDAKANRGGEKDDDDDDDGDSEADEENEESKQVLARSIVETIRDDWKGLFLRKADPSQPAADSTMWVDIGFVESVEEVEMLFEQNIRKMERAQEEHIKQEALDMLKQQRASSGLNRVQGQVSPAHRRVQQPQHNHAIPQPVRRDPQDLETAATGMMTMAAQAPPTSSKNRAPMISTLPPLPASLGGLPHAQEQPMPSLRAAINGNSGVPPLAMPPLAQQQRDVTMQEWQATTADTLQPQQYLQEGQPLKKKRGRPRKDEIRPPVIQGPKRKRGRPKKSDAEKATDATKLVKESKAKQGRRKLICVPGPRDAHSIAPPQEALDVVHAGGTLLLSPGGKRSKTFDFRVDESIANQHQDQNPMEVTDPSAEDGGKGTVRTIQLPEPAFKFPFPPPLELEANQPRNKVAQARQFVNAKDPKWTNNYDLLACCRISLYCNGQPQRWASGLVRSSKGSYKQADTTLSHWFHDQQIMYREYCQWEDQQILKPRVEQPLHAGAQPEEHAQQQQQRQSLQKKMQQRMQKGQQVIVGAAALPEVLPDGIRLPQLGQNGGTTAGSVTVTGSGGTEVMAATLNKLDGKKQDSGKETSQQADDRTKNVPPSGTAQETLVTGSLTNTQEDLRELQRAKILLLDDVNFVWQPDQDPPADAPQDWKESFYDLREYLRSRGDTSVSDSVELGVWAQLQRIKYQRSLAAMANESIVTNSSSDMVLKASQEARPDPPLTRGQMAALRGLGFDWQDLESSQFHVMYLKLLEFKHRVGDCLVPPPPTLRDLEPDDDDDGDDDADEDDEDCIVETKADPNLFFWVQRQRLEKVRFDAAQELTKKEQQKSGEDQQSEEQVEGVDEAGHALVKELMQEEKEAEETAASQQQKKQNPVDVDAHESEDNDDATVVAHLVATPSKRTKHARLMTASAEKETDKNAVISSNKRQSENPDSEKTIRRAHAAILSSTKKKRTQQQVRSSDSVSTLTQAQINLLNSADFIWSFDISLPWILQYRRLHAFYIKHGHSKVTRTTNQSKTKLNRWCSQVRQLHQRRLTGKKHALSDEKLKLLQRLDFIFEFEDLPERYSFKERFGWLKKYKEQHGSLIFLSVR